MELQGIKVPLDSLGLYFSVPFCRSKCTYCNFASGVFPPALMGGYVERLRRGVAEARQWTANERLCLPETVDSIYLGGGTPSLLAPEMIRSLFASVSEQFHVAPGTEATLECAPGQLESATLDAMLECGVNRISFGVQSFIDREAKATGRLHTRAMALADIERVWRAGVQRVSVDLIAGLPHQTAASWAESLAVLAGCGVDHASIYMLEVDEDSRLGREALSLGQRYSAARLPLEDEAADYYEQAAEALARQGITQYEISNFARSGHESSHNLKYWQRRPYLGLGLDAHSMLRTSSGAAVRFAYTDDFQQFLKAAAWPEPVALARREEMEEAFFLGLRMNAGVDLDEFGSEFGIDAMESFAGIIRDLTEEGLLMSEGPCIRLTSRGRLLANDVFERFLLEEERVSAAR